jgi:hypothetical protein
MKAKKNLRMRVQDINRTFKVLGSEMKLMESQFDKQDQSLEAVTARNEQLNKAIDAQKGQDQNP